MEDKRNGFLPVSRQDMEDMGLEALDFVYVCGDAYVDHPSFGSAIISRILVSHGYSVGMICQPDWKDPESINVFGEPRLGFLVSSGNMDSMVNHYTVAKKHRHEDAYSPGGEMGKRPDRAVIVYGNLIRKIYKKTPIIIGGIEASLRRMGHYDYWDNKVRRSILLDSGADLISYGMGEKSIVEIADALNSGLAVGDISFINGTVYKTRNEDDIADAIRLPDFEQIREEKKAYAQSVAIQYENTDPFQAKRIYETYDGALFVVQNPPQKPLTTMEMDDIYALPYMRDYHPMYKAAGGIPALEEIKFSLTSNRGCYGACSFCALTFHEGRIVQARSHASILAEAKEMLEDKDFKGYIHDVGGPTAEFRAPACKKQLKAGACKNRQCLWPRPCPNLEVDHSDYLKLLRKLRELPRVKKVFVRSGFRFDYLMADKDKTFLREIAKYHVSGQMRVAPEHISDNVLKRMGKPGTDVYDSFVKEFEKVNKQLGLDQYIVPYLMSSHPGSTMADAIALARYERKIGINPRQVQDFYPTPGTISTCMFYTGIDPRDMSPVYVASDPHEKAMQRALIQFHDPKNYDLVKEALLREGREDLIGYGPDCLIPPRKLSHPDGKNGGKFSDKAGGNPAGRPGGKIDGNHAGKSGDKAVGNHTGRPGGKIDGNHTGRPGGNAGGNHTGRLGGNAGGNYTGKSGGRTGEAHNGRSFEKKGPGANAKSGSKTSVRSNSRTSVRTNGRTFEKSDRHSQGSAGNRKSGTSGRK